MPGGELRLEPVRLGEAEALGQEHVGLLQCGRGEDDVAEAHAVGEEAAGDQRRGRTGSARRPAAGRPRRRRPRAPWSGRAVAPARSPRVPVATSAPIALQPADCAVERLGVDRLEADRDRVVGRARLDEHPVGASVVAPGVRPRCRRLAGHEADHVGEHLVRGCRDRAPRGRGNRALSDVPLRSSSRWWSSECR